MVLNKNLDIIHISYTGNTEEDCGNEKHESFLVPDYFGESPCVPALFKNGDLVCPYDELENVMMLVTAKEDGELNMYNFSEILFNGNGEIEVRAYDPFEYAWTNNWIELEYFRGDLEKNKEKIARFSVVADNMI